MSHRLTWTIVGVALFCLWFGQLALQSWAQADRGAGVVPSDRLIVLRDGSTGGAQHVVIVDPVRRAMSTYSVHPQTGEIALKSVRNFAWDLELETFNAAAPAPRDIKALLETP